MLASGLLFVDDVNEYLSPRDKNGHGTHTSSTAGGGVVPDADFFGFANGTARGLAPRARLAMYKACWSTVGCYKSDILAAIDNAVRDGVDVLSLSIGSPFGQDLYDSDPVAVGTFAAARAGIFVTCSAGNSGPYAGTVTNSAPWVATVGAGTIDRSFPARVVLGNGKVLLGQSLYFQEVNQSEMIELVYVGLCYPDLLVPATVMGKIVICNDASVGTGLDVEEAGAAGLIAVNLPRDGEGIIVQRFTLPAVAVSYAAEGDIRKYLNSSAGKPVAMLELRYRRTVIGETRAPTVAGFSSRGPSQASPEILKPDVIAPGMNILAAWPPESPLYKDNYEDPRRSAFNIISGTSMACPHVAGLAAALRGAHPTWTPAMVRSAIMTTAATLDNNYRPIIANENSQPATPFAVGAGHINPPTARDPGLVYDAGVQDYIDFLCALNYTDEQRLKIVGGPTTCSEIQGGVAGINYPSFVVIFNNRTSTKVLKRTLKKVYELPEIYKVRIVNPMPEKVEVRVKPDLLEFKGVNEIRSYEVEFKSKVVMKGNDKCEEYGFIIWENMEHQVKSPVVFMWE
ncbi:subtilisin-like protease SBT1.8 [Typha angustifolia]|uniref:subtilisin-like protease SBT1.8 n=1 Tax=Typha angustifolia TaxID=59011 RepID=UPI003C2C34BC